MAITIAQELIDRFHTKYIRRGYDECWPWTDAPSGSGYGNFRVNPYRLGAHVVAWMIANGRVVTPGMEVIHSCNNKICVNPNHLSEDTYSQNMVQAIEDGLSNVRSGADHYESKKTHCPYGHPYSGSNLGIDRNQRYCRQCMNARSRERKARQRQRERAA